MYSDFKPVSVSIETILGENEEFDKNFFEYLDEYSISYKIFEPQSELSSWPIVEYTGGPIAITNMLKERFGMETEEIKTTYPNITNELL